MAEQDEEMRSLALTPTWSVAVVLTVFVVVSLVVERSIHRLSHGHEPFVSYEGLEQLHRFIFVMAITHVSYSCLTMLLAIVKIKEKKVVPRSKIHNFCVYMGFRMAALASVKTCFFRQFGRSVVRADYLTLRMGFIMNHNLTVNYDFHNYMIRSMEEEFQKIVGVSAPLWGFVVAFMLFNVKVASPQIPSFLPISLFTVPFLEISCSFGHSYPIGYYLTSITGSNLYFWIAIIPVSLVLLVGAKLQHIIATLALENAGIIGFNTGRRLRPRDDLFWFKKPELLLSLIHFILFQNAFELASFFWFWWQFGYSSCFIRNHLLVYIRLIIGFAGQFLCSYSTLPLYALVTQLVVVSVDQNLPMSRANPRTMGTNYKAALIPQRIRETIHGWKKDAKRRRRRGYMNDDSTIRTETSTVLSLEEDEREMYESVAAGTCIDIELQPTATVTTSPSPAVPNDGSSRIGTPLLQPSSSLSSTSVNIHKDEIRRSYSMPGRRGFESP
ncbi:hypothetical protein IFM89_036508 [Coptis chinensis]|uniref:MLO-like protein n=1 Tax=Coptis chinensis TaxID=261450 RepID=A0A835I783_9MAGN|nr:hypothetical protein IFM89_036508 [Coptis chinensis]